jgi:hypothetical protein
MSATASVFRLQPIDDSFPVNGASTSITSFDFGVTLEQIHALLAEEEPDDQPSPEAYERTMGLLRRTAERSGMKFPRALAVATGPSRSVRLIWMREQKELRLMIGGTPANRSYIYWRTGTLSGIDENIDPEYLAAYFNWLTLDS